MKVLSIRIAQLALISSTMPLLLERCTTMSGKSPIERGLGQRTRIAFRGVIFQT